MEGKGLNIKYEIKRIHLFDEKLVNLLKDLYSLKDPKSREDLFSTYKAYLRELKKILNIKNVISLGQSYTKDGKDCVVIYIYDHEVSDNSTEEFMVGRDYEVGKNFIYI